MDLGKIALFDTMKGRFAWLGQRQKVLAANIANADTPRFRPSDIEPFAFQELMRRQAGRLDMETTRAAHLGGRPAQVGTFAEKVDRHPFETTPNGNAVVLEEQMAKVNETSVAHKLTTELYRKHLGMIRLALGRH